MTSETSEKSTVLLMWVTMKAFALMETAFDPGLVSTDRIKLTNHKDLSWIFYGEGYT